MKDRQELEELISAYALGALDGEELKEAEEIIASGSADALELLREYQDVTSNLSYASKGVMPEPALKKKVLTEILGTRELPVPETSPPFWSDDVYSNMSCSVSPNTKNLNWSLGS